MTTSEIEAIAYRNRMTREIAEQIKLNETRVKTFRTQSDIEMQKLKDLIGGKITEINIKLKYIDDKIANVDDTMVVMDKVDVNGDNADDAWVYLRK